MAVLSAVLPCAAAGKLTKYTTKYYILHTDLDKEMTREAIVRITAMAEEYYNRTKGFAGRINTRFPFYLYKNAEDYNRHPGVVAGSSGIYKGRSLIAIAPRPGRSWHTVQHEGFHQFAHKMIRGRLPTWLNEGLAEYFAGGLWTGDDLVVGLISSYRLKRVRLMISGKTLMPLSKMLDMTQREWNKDIRSQNYLQAWSMVHFLVHADKGKYEPALSGYIRDLSKGRSSSAAFRKRFGDNTKAFQAGYTRWWSGLGDKPTADLYTKARVLTLTSFLARARYADRKFEDIEGFFKAAGDGTFEKVFVNIAKRDPTMWLPISLLNRTLDRVGNSDKWSLVHQKTGTNLKYTGDDGTVFLGSYVLNSRPKISVKITKPQPESTTRPKRPSRIIFPLPLRRVSAPRPDNGTHTTTNIAHASRMQSLPISPAAPGLVTSPADITNISIAVHARTAGAGERRETAVPLKVKSLSTSGQ